MSVADMIAAELDDLHADETSPGMAAVALDLAKAIDASDAPTAKAVVADKLRPIMSDLRKLAPIGEEGDALDELTRKREARRRGA
ncbi:hypothetical protein ACFVTY_02130 [Streptomyces sp. NPDC058067]|uniref:hypothetical protein n=1 Tax=Streptomyces sp. NPDC058067 TaxID=3346324 RepID=UPI0036E2B588